MGGLFLGFKEIERTSMDETLYVFGRRLFESAPGMIFTSCGWRRIVEKQNKLSGKLIGIAAME